MSLVVREMKVGEEEHVVAMVRGLARETEAGITPQLTADGLAKARNLVDLVVADIDGELVGACLTLMTYSTWRGAPGAYVVDLFVAGPQRGRGIGEKLLGEAARRAHRRGAAFVKLEVDCRNEAAMRFYERVGFHQKESDRLFILEPDDFSALVTRKEPA